MSLKTQNKQGFTLVEVLVALVVLAIGLLGLATLQGRALGGGHSAYLRSQATLYAYDILERMRVNREEAMTLPSPYTLADYGDVSAATPGTRADDDLDEWLGFVNGLPGGEARINLSNEEKGRILVQIFVRWNEKVMKTDAGGNPIQPEIVVRTIL